MASLTNINNYVEKLTDTLSSYRVEGFLCDTVLIASNGELHAHSAILAASSPVFKVAMETDVEYKLHYINLPEMDTQTLELALNLMYTGRFVLPAAYTSAEITSLRLAFGKLGIERQSQASKMQLKLSRDEAETVDSEVAVNSKVISNSEFSETLHLTSKNDYSEVLVDGRTTIEPETSQNTFNVNDSMTTLSDCESSPTKRRKVPKENVSRKLRRVQDVDQQRDISNNTYFLVESEKLAEQTSEPHPASTDFLNIDEQDNLQNQTILVQPRRKVSVRLAGKGRKKWNKDGAAVDDDERSVVAQRAECSPRRKSETSRVKTEPTADELIILSSVSDLEFGVVLCKQEEPQTTASKREEDCFPEKQISSYWCPSCEYTTNYQNDLRKHILCHKQETQRNVRKFKCTECPKMFRKVSHLQSHALTHSGERPHKCLVCGRMFSSLGNLSRHSLVHSATKPHLCDHCGKGFIRKLFLLNHVATHHQTNHLPVWQCKDCDVMFPRKLSLVRHRLQNHGSLDIALCESSKEAGELDSCDNGATAGCEPVICDVCGKSFVSLTTLRTHARIHKDSTELMCTTCNRTYSSVTNLRLHTKAAHSGENSYLCTLCNKSFAMKRQLNLHLVRHTGTKNYQCDICPMTFVLDSSLQSHRKWHAYSAIRLHSCPYCSKPFRSPASLATHIRTHTGEKPFPCSECTMSFKQSAHLTRHMRSHTGEKPFKCEMCTRAYKNMLDLRYHYTRFHHVDKSSNCV